jgi:hypothetical protein
MGILVLYRTDAMVYAVGFLQRHLSDLDPKDYCQGNNFSQTTKPRVAHNKVVTAEGLESAYL